MTSWQPEVTYLAQFLDVMNIKVTNNCTRMCKWWQSIYFCVYYAFNCVLLGYLAIPSLSILLFALSRHHLTILTSRRCGSSVDRKTGNGFMFGLRVKRPNISSHVTQSDIFFHFKMGKSLSHLSSLKASSLGVVVPPLAVLLGKLCLYELHKGMQSSVNGAEIHWCFYCLLWKSNFGRVLHIEFFEML